MKILNEATAIKAKLSIFAMAATALMSSLQASAQTTTTTSTVSPARYEARTMLARLTGILPAIDDTRLDQMEPLIASGDRTSAAKIAVKDPNFLNIVVRNIAEVMSNRPLLVTNPLNDFVATYIGVVRDGRNAKEMLTGNYIYMADPTLVPSGVTIRSDPVNDILMSNNHYLDIDANIADIQSVLKQSPQQLVNGSSAAVTHPEPAGLLTTRDWGSEHLIAGTNRRAVQFTFSQFLCQDISGFADTTGPDNMISQDVDRFPQGDNSVYQNKCKGCHTMLDFMRPAWAHMDFTDNYVKSTLLLSAGSSTTQANINSNTGLMQKYYSNTNVFPAGFVVPNTQWINNATSGTNATYFGWRGATSGTGLQSWAQMLANSQAFSRCFVKKYFRAICNRDPVAGTEDSMVQTLASGLEADNYNLKDLAVSVASRPECLGQ